MTTITLPEKMAAYESAIKSGNEAELLEALLKIRLDFELMLNQVESMQSGGQLSSLEDNPDVMGVWTVRDNWRPLYEKCKEVTQADGNVRGLLLEDDGVPCLKWLDDLRDHLAEIKKLVQN